MVSGKIASQCSIQLLFNNKFLLLLDSWRKRRRNSLWSSFGRVLFRFLLYFLIVKPFCGEISISSFVMLCGFYLFIFHFSFSLGDCWRGQAAVVEVIRETQMTRLSLFSLHREEILEAKQDIYYSIRFRFFQFQTGSGWSGERWDTNAPSMFIGGITFRAHVKRKWNFYKTFHLLNRNGIECKNLKTAGAAAKNSTKTPFLNCLM